MRSDNGTNFIGADREFKYALKQLDQLKITTFLSNQMIEWKFNPPVSPWMGGVWEALVKSVKRALKAVTRDRLFTDDALSTLFCEVESVINQRPLTPISDSISFLDIHHLIHQLETSIIPKLIIEKNGKTSKLHQICYGKDGQGNIFPL